MAAGADTVGIAGSACYIPAGFVSSEQIAADAGIPLEVLTKKIGLLRKPVAAPDEHPSGMALAAARPAIERARIAPADVDLIIYAGATPQDYLLWSPAAKLQEQLGARSCYAFEIANGCNGLNLGINVGKQLLLSDARLRHALIASADKYSAFLDHTRRDDASLFHLSDAAGAVVLRRNEPTNRLLAYVQRTDGSLADHVRISRGGTRHPCGEPGAKQSFSVHDRAALEAVLSRTYVDNYVSVIRAALAQCDRSVEDVAFLFTNQVKASTMATILKVLGVPASNTLRSLPDHGHMAAVDTLFGLDSFLRQGRIQPGDLVVLASSAVGFSWSATVVQY